MSVHFQKELENLKKRILSLGAMVEERVRMAINAIETEDSSFAQRIIDADSEVDETEVEIEEECLKTLALHQPVAVDLRFITAVIKINNDLERIGDEAVNIAQRVVVMAKRTNIDPVFDYSYMAEKAEYMLRKSLDALVNLDLDLALKVCLLDDEVDRMRDEVYDIVKNSLFDNRDDFGYLINLLLISRHLERIADYATNIAEEVIYMVQGEIVRHGKLTPRLKENHS